MCDILDIYNDKVKVSQMKLIENSIIKIGFTEIPWCNALIWYLAKQELMIIELATFQIAVSSSFRGAYKWSQERKMIS